MQTAAFPPVHSACTQGAQALTLCLRVSSSFTRPTAASVSSMGAFWSLGRTRLVAVAASLAVEPCTIRWSHPLLHKQSYSCPAAPKVQHLLLLLAVLWPALLAGLCDVGGRSHGITSGDIKCQRKTRSQHGH